MYVITFRPLPRRTHRPCTLCVRTVSVEAAAAETTIPRTRESNNRTAAEVHIILLYASLYTLITFTYVLGTCSSSRDL